MARRGPGSLLPSTSTCASGTKSLAEAEVGSWEGEEGIGDGAGNGGGRRKGGREGRMCLTSKGRVAKAAVRDC